MSKQTLSSRFSNKTISRGDNGAWHFGQAGASSAQRVGLEAGLEYSPGETFTTTERGGHYVSAFCPHVQVSVPPGATNKTLHVTLQVTKKIRVEFTKSMHFILQVTKTIRVGFT